MGRGGRTNIKGKPASKKKHVRITYTYAFKYDVLVDYLDGYGHRELQARYTLLANKSIAGIRCLVSKWMNKVEHITRMASHSRTASHGRYRAFGVGTTLTSASEWIIVKWINELRRDGVPISSRMLGIKAEEVAEDQGIPSDLFSASNTWKVSFLGRHKLSFRARNRADQASPDDDATIGRAFATEVRAWMAEHRTTRVYNADQTGVNFEMLPKVTVHDRGAPTVWVRCGKKEKQRMTAMLLADNDGNKYMPWLVVKTRDSSVEGMQAENNTLRHGFGTTLWEEIQDIQRVTGAEIYGNPTAWWNEDITVAWLEYFFGDRHANSEPVLLLLDSFSGHWTTQVAACAKRLNVHLKCVPPKLTWRCQPADVAWMKPLKDGLRRRWVDHLREQLARHSASSRNGRKFSMVPPDRGDVAEWILEGWDRLSDSIIVSGFVKCGFRDPLSSVPTEEPQEEPYDTADLIDDLRRVGFVDNYVGEVQEGTDVLEAPAEDRANVSTEAG